ncbi:MAG: RNA methyltransferase [Pseudomonadota bacterium]
MKALFAGAPERVERLFFLPEMKDEVGGYCRILAHGRKIFRETPADELERIAGSAMHGGIVAVARPKPVPPLDLDETRRWAKDTPLLPILHGVGNPHNFGAIARTAAFLGLPRLVISDHPAQAGLSDAAFRIAEGGFECLELYRATDFAQTLRQLRETFRVVGAAVGRGTSPDRIPRDKPIALVLGNEETGLDATTLAACDEAVTIQGTGAIQSLNVSVAAGVLLYALRPAPGAK